MKATSVVFAGVASLALAGAAAAQDAKTILKSMSDYVGSQKNISVSFDSDVEVMTNDLEKIQFTSSGQLQATRPDKLHVSRTGGYSDVELYYDGKTVTVRDKATNSAATVPAPASIDGLVDDLRNKLGIEAPGADLILTKVGDELTKDVLEANYIGQGVVDGVLCEHLAFRNAEVDWQLWVEVGSKPVPRKYVITSKTLTGAPQYTLRLSKWSDAAVDAAAFTMSDAGVKAVDLRALSNIDEVPAGSVMEMKP
jgi:hypothetical protein